MSLITLGESPVEISDSVGRVTNKSLVISSLKAEYAGTYSCEADNGIGKPIKKIVKVYVHGEKGSLFIICVYFFYLLSCLRQQCINIHFLICPH